MDISSEDVLQKIKYKTPSELECFQLLLNGNDQKIKLAVLFLVKQQGNPNHLSLVLPFLEDPDKKITHFAQEANQNIASNTSLNI